MKLLRELVHNKLTAIGLGVIVSILVLAVLAPAVVPYPDDARGIPNMGEQFKPPSASHPFGTDDLGRDLLSRVMAGTRISLRAGTSVVLLAMLIGIPLGAMAGYHKGTDQLVMRVADMFLGFPPLLLALAVAAMLGPGLNNAMLAISLTWWPWYTRLVRGQVVSLKEQEFVEAAKAIGASDLRIVFRHILPNCVAPVVVQATMDVGYAILMASTLSFIGLGAQAPQPEWGLLVATGRMYFLEHWWYSAFPGLAIFVTVLAFNLTGDGLRDVLDPRLKR